MTRLRELVEQTRAELVRYPAVDPEVFQAKLDRFLDVAGEA
ncbi:MAG: hypothetical protein AAF211_19390 [Myxococcota bacterium]